VKTFYQQNNVGKARYTINYHDGLKHHPDGSDFYDIAIFHHRDRFNLFIDKLTSMGYQEKGSHV